jgi:PAT family beta-lactamase induction signal transducer AmpG
VNPGLWHKRESARGLVGTIVGVLSISTVPDLFSSLFNRRMLLCCLIGFTSGLPMYVLVQLVPAWLRTEGVDLKSIGLFSLTTIPYAVKFAWAPLMDKVTPSRLGRRRGWALLMQLGLLASLMSLALFDPTESLRAIGILCFVVAFFSATQDVVLDAYRREILPDHELGIGNSLSVNAYRISSLVPGSLGFILADTIPWSAVHVVVASFMFVGILTTLWMPEPASRSWEVPSLKEIVVAPFVEFVERMGVRGAVAVLVFMLLYKVGDTMATALATPFYLDLGFSKTEIGTVAKIASLWASIVGGLFGGLVMVKIGINRALWCFGVVQMVSIGGFVVLSEAGPNIDVLFWVVSFEYLGVGLGTAAFVAFIARATNPQFTATQFALLTSLTAIPRSVANSTTGYLVELIGWTSFFMICLVVAVPGMVLLWWVAPWNGDRPRRGPSNGAGSGTHSGIYGGQMKIQTVQELHEVVQQGAKGVIILDVRGPAEFARGRVPGAINMPHDQVAARFGELEAGKPVHVYCKMGGRAQHAANSLVAAGVDVCRVEAGGMDLWTSLGFPVER